MPGSPLLHTGAFSPIRGTIVHRRMLPPWTERWSSLQTTGRAYIYREREGDICSFVGAVVDQCQVVSKLSTHAAQHTFMSGMQHATNVVDLDTASRIVGHGATDYNSSHALPLLRNKCASLDFATAFPP